MKLAIQDDSNLQIEATRTELIRMAIELLQQASDPERVDNRRGPSPCHFEFDRNSDQFEPTVVHNGLKSCSFVRVDECPVSP